MPEAKKKANSRRIMDAEDFGLFFNCLTRRFLWDLDPAYADLMIRIMDRYLYYFSKRTLICSIRDLAEDKYRMWHERDRKDMGYEDERYQNILKRLVQRYLDIELADKADDYWKGYVIQRLGTEGYFTAYYTDQKNWRFPSLPDFEKWVADNHLDEGERIPLYKGDTLPFRAEFREDFLLLCLATVDYSYGRYSYMPGACRGFIEKHFILIKDEGLRKIDAEIEAGLRDYPLSDDFMGKDETGAWKNYRETIRLELIRREWRDTAWNIYCKNKGLAEVIGGLADTEQYASEEDCVTAAARLEGLDLWLHSSKCHLGDKKNYQEQVESAKRQIGLKAEQLWLKDHADQYIKIGPHTYLKRKDNL